MQPLGRHVPARVGGRGGVGVFTCQGLVGLERLRLETTHLSCEKLENRNGGVGALV